MFILKWYDKETGEIQYSSTEDRSIINNFGCFLTLTINGWFSTFYIPDKNDVEKYEFVEDLNSGRFTTLDLVGKIGQVNWEAFTNEFKPDAKKKIPETYIITEEKKYTFGIEVETIYGILPKYIRNSLNISCHYDGSMRDNNGNKSTGGEYVTGILKGDNGFFQLKNILFEISRRCEINKTCSIHVHLGGMVFNKEFIVASYKLGLLLQNEIFSMMPSSRRKNEYCGKIPMHLPFSSIITNNYRSLNKEKKEKFLDNAYKNLVSIVSMTGEPRADVNKRLNHPHGKVCGWNRSSPRYWWLNFVPSLFTIEKDRNHTLEFRCHSATLNYEKVKNWILICMAFVYFVENNQARIFEINNVENSDLKLDEIINFSYKYKNKYLINYINERKSKFRISSNENSEYSYISNLNQESNKLIDLL